MNKHDLQALSITSLLDLLNKSFLDKPEFILKQFEEGHSVESFDGLCSDCYHQTVQKFSGDEGCTWCENCQLAEGKTLEITVVHPLKVAYIWDKLIWVKSSEDMGSEF